MFLKWYLGIARVENHWFWQWTLSDLYRVGMKLSLCLIWKNRNLIQDLIEDSIQNRNQYQLSLTSWYLRKDVTFLFTQEFNSVYIYYSKALLFLKPMQHFHLLAIVCIYHTWLGSSGVTVTGTRKVTKEQSATALVQPCFLVVLAYILVPEFFQSQAQS